MKIFRLRGLLLTALMIVVSPLFSQTTTFSNRQSLGNDQSVYRALKISNDKIYVSGIANGVPPDNYNSTHLIIFNLDGSLFDDHLLESNDLSIRGWGLMNDVTSSGNFLFTGDFIEEGRQGVLAEVDENLSLIDTAFYSGVPNNLGVKFVVFSGVLATENYYLVYGSEFNPNTTVNGQRGVLLKYNLDLEPIDTVRIVESTDDRASGMVGLTLSQQGGHLAMSREFERQGCSPAWQFSLFWLDDAMNVLKRYDSDETTTALNGLIETISGSVLIQTSAVEHIDFDAGGGNCIPFPVFRNTISKVSGGVAPQLEWEFSFDPPGARRWPEVIQAGIVPTPSPDEFVAAASYKAEQVVLANLVKFDTLGNEIWNRVYGYYDTTDNDVYVYDIKPAPDGGYIMVGQVIVPFTEASDSLGRFPPQQGWIMKVDEDGCLIPGCGDVTITSTRPGEPLPAPELLLYPNPVAHTLYFYLPEIPEATSLSGAVYDATGRIVRELPDRPLVPGMTYSLPVDELPAGTYYLRLSLDDGRMVTKPFLKH